MSLKGKLNRLKTHLNLDTGSKTDLPTGNLLQMNGTQDIPYIEKWKEMGGNVHVFEEEHIFIREVAYPITYQHGHYRLGELEEVVNRWNENRSNHPLSAKGRRVSDLLFFDTETTGLAHGAGNTIFLLGCSQFTGDQVIVRQYFLPGPESEVALYHRFLSDARDLKNLVTYNGKAFDWPQVKTRHTLIRDVLPKLPAFGHYDLLHGARRLWKNRLESCRLSVVEEHVLGIKRMEDTPGFLAPMLYFDYLREKDPEIIKGVLVHNEIDVLSLITLYIHVSKMLLKKHTERLTRYECYEMGRWYEYIGEEEDAEDFYLQAADHFEKPLLQAKMALANLYKKKKQIDHAVQIWTELDQSTDFIHEEVLIELSKAYEHQYKEYDKALHYASKALANGKRNQRIIDSTVASGKAALVKRIERLENKLQRACQVND